MILEGKFINSIWYCYNSLHTFRFQIETTETKFKGFQNFILREFQLEPTVDKTKLIFEFEIEVPRVNITGSYKLTGLSRSTNDISGEGLFQ